MQNRTPRGYTLVELLAVSAIISILAAMSFALISRMRSQAIETNALSAMNTLATAYEMYYFVHNEYPHWGQDQDFSTPTEIIDYLVNEDFLPGSFGHYDYNSETSEIFGLTQDYSVEIVEFIPSDPIFSNRGSFFIILHPYRFQKDRLAIGLNPPSGWVADRPRRGADGTDFRTFGLYTFKQSD